MPTEQVDYVDFKGYVCLNDLILFKILRLFYHFLNNFEHIVFQFELLLQIPILGLKFDD